MCGIAGIVYKNQQVEPAQLHKMADAMAHRGPDGVGTFAQEHIGFAHRRLAIIDLSDSGQQPMHYQGLTITYNGEIYNYLELKSTLQQAGYHFKTQTDTEVILIAYHYWGQHCVQHFNGMWAFAIYNKVDNTIFLSRDRFGIKPLYYFKNKESFIFASEIKALLAVGILPKINMQMAANYLVTEASEHPQHTFFANINKLPAAHNILFNLNSYAFEQLLYYQPQINSSQQSLSEVEAIQLLQNQLNQAVKYRLRSDVEVGTCLSGGLDSSAITAIATGILGKNNSDFRAFTGVTHNGAISDEPFAKTLVKTLGIQWNITEPTTADYVNSQNSLMLAQEEPFHSPSIAMQYFVMQLASNQGLKVLLDGQGADELLLGYLPHIPAVEKMGLAPKGFGWYNQLLKSNALNAKQLALLFAYFGNPTLKGKRIAQRWKCLQHDFLMEVMHQFKANNRPSDNLLQYQTLQLYNTSLPALLRFEDKNSMHFSIETRLPFLDYNLVETIVSMPPTLLFKQGWSKYALREAVKDILPHSIAWRKGKLGFEAPKAWQLQLAETSKDAIQNSAILNLLKKPQAEWPSQGAAQWRLASLAKWEQIFNVVS